jgi:hypothetical protein
VPSRLIVEWCRLSNDPVTASKMIDDHVKQLYEEAGVQENENDIKDAQ